jgi:hypothetical protein
LTTLNKYLPQINNLQHTRQVSWWIIIDLSDDASFFIVLFFKLFSNKPCVFSFRTECIKTRQQSFFHDQFTFHNKFPSLPLFSCLHFPTFQNDFRCSKIVCGFSLMTILTSHKKPKN